MLTDTGPLIALLDRIQALTLHVFSYGGFSQSTLWGLVQDRGLSINSSSGADMHRMYSLRVKYNGTPMDLASLPQKSH